jgi:hypothetical protein
MVSNNNGGSLGNHALTNGFLTILHFLIFKKSNTIMTCSRFSNPSAEILHVDDISYAAFGHQILQGAFVRIGILALGVLQILNM